MVVYVLGNIVLDETFTVDTLPGTGQSLLGRAAMRDLGGKGANQAVVLARSGVEVRLVGACGRDPRGDELVALLGSEPCDISHVLRCNEPSDVTIALCLPNGENALVTTTDAAEAIAPSDVEPALADARAGDWLVLQGNLSFGTTEAAVTLAKQKGMCVALNPSPVKPSFAALFDACDLVIVNESEAEAFTGHAGEAGAEAILAAGAGCAVVTLGEAGSVLHRADGRIAKVDAEPARVVDTTGAGDTFAAVLLAARLRRGQFDAECLKAAGRAAAFTVARFGCRAAFPHREAFAAIFEENAGVASGRPAA